MRPPVIERKLSRFSGQCACPEKILQPARNQRVALHVEENICRMVGRKCRKSQRFAIRSSEGEDFKTGRSVGLLGPVGTRRALEARLSDEFLQRVVRKFVNLYS